MHSTSYGVSWEDVEPVSVIRQEFKVSKGQTTGGYNVSLILILSDGTKLFKRDYGFVPTNA